MVFYDLDLYMPISLVDKNISESIKNNSTKSQYYFKKNINTELLDLNIIINYLIELINKYLDTLNIPNIRKCFDKYLNYIKDLANNNQKTEASLFRDFVINHSKYNNDSILNDEITFDLLNEIIANLLVSIK